MTVRSKVVSPARGRYLVVALGGLYVLLGVGLLL
jgi:hypothetical protein